MHTPERESRTPSSTRTGARKLAATASLAAAAVVGGAAAGSAPAIAANVPQAAAETRSPAFTPAATLTPIATLKANHSTVKVGAPVTFTVTERTPAGTPVSYADATFYVHAKKGWKRVGTEMLSSGGAATFTFHPKHDHAYRVDLSAGAVDGAEVEAINTKTVTVKVPTAKASTVKADLHSEIVAMAARQSGKPYRYGAAGPNSFDCSGLVQYVFGKFGIHLPHNADAQLGYGKHIARADARPGDLVFVMSGSYASHVAIYAGNGYWWEAPHTGANVRHVKIWTSNVTFRRIG